MSHLIELMYLAAGLLFILALRWLSHPSTSRRGVQAGEIGMALAVVGTLLKAEIVSYQWILLAVFIGSAIGVPMALFMPMTAMPQRIALSHAFGALAAALVGSAEFYLGTLTHQPFTRAALGAEVLLGFLTFTGSLVAFGKLQGLLSDRPFVFRGQNAANLTLLGASLAMVGILVADPGRTWAFPVLIGLSLLFGVSFVIRIGGADMPTTISLLNSFAGLSGAAMGFVLDNKVLIVAGALDGSSGFLLALLMCRAMNRSFANVLFSGLGRERTTGKLEQRPVRSASPEDAAMILETAGSVIIVPGYGMAAAQAQHKVRELSDELARHGVRVKFAIHPVAGRMPGHMNVLLAEANVPYDQMFDLDHINDEFPQADVALVIGANDVVNPAARHDRDNPLFGMPILDADRARCVMVVKRSMRTGFAGVENELFFLDRTLMLFGDARQVIGELVNELSRLPVA
jgi:proton-translocating NAD(P)+ transhydrogenase subunit beta